MQTRMGHVLEKPSGMFGKRNVNEGSCSSILETKQHDQMLSLKIENPIFARTESIGGEFTNFNTINIGNLNLSNQNTNHFIIIPQGGTPAGNFALQQIMLTACQAYVFGCNGQSWPIVYSNMAKESIMTGDNKVNPESVFSCQQQ